MNKLIFRELSLSEALELQEIVDIDVYFFNQYGGLTLLSDDNLKHSIIIEANYYILED